MLLSVVLKNEDTTEKMELEEYLVGVVACEMPVLYGSVALKSQAIASRTYAVKKTNNNISLAKTTDDQCYIDDEEMKNKWKDKYSEYRQIVVDAVNDTKGIVITKDDQLLTTFYFSTSNGYTEDSMDVFNYNGVESVESSWDKNSSNYKREVVFKKEYLESILGSFKKIEIVLHDNKKPNKYRFIQADDDNEIREICEDKEYYKINSKAFKDIRSIVTICRELTEEVENHIEYLLK